MADAQLVFDLLARDRASQTFKNVGKAADGTHKGMKPLDGTMKKLAVGFAGLAVISKVTGFLKASTAEAREAQKTGAQTAAVIKSTGGAAHLSAKGFGELATAISNKTGIDDEAIQAGENMLATFTNVRNEVGKGKDIFTQATKVATDFGVATKMGPVQANMMLGKALNDPLKGMTKLQKVGVTFTDAQKKQAEQMMKTGNVAGAQKIILKELAKEFGGSAAAQATAGDKLKVTWGNFQEMIGGKILPALDKLEIALADGIGWISTNGDKVKLFATIFGSVAAGVLVGVGAFKAITAVTKAWTIAQLILNGAMVANPIGLIAVGIGLLVGAFILAYAKVKWFRDGVNATVGFIKAHWQLLLAIFGGPVVAAVILIVKNFDKVKSAFSTIGHVFRAVYNAALGPVFSLILKGIAMMMSLWGKMLSALGHVPGFGWAKKAGELMSDAARKADGLSDNIRHIPNSKHVAIAVTAAQAARAVSSLAYQMSRLRDKTIHLRVVGGKTPGFASGTDNAPAGAAWVGEHGKELMFMHGGEKIVPHNESMVMAKRGGSASYGSGGAGSSGGVTFNITVNGSLDGDQVAEKIRAMLLKLQRTTNTPLGFKAA